MLIRNTLISLLLVNSFSVRAQSIKILEGRIDSIDQLILTHKKEIKRCDSVRSVYEEELMQLNIKVLEGSSVRVILYLDANVKEYPSKLAPVIFLLEKGTEVSVFDYNVLGYYEIEIDQRKGWIPESCFEQSTALKTFRTKKELQKKEAEEEMKKREKESNSRLVEGLIKKYGQSYGKAISEHKIMVGMTKEMVTESWGMPDKLNKSVGEWGTNEQWVYGNQYVYFEKDKVSSFQSFE